MALTNPSSNSSAYLAADAQFQARVKGELMVYCGTVYNEAVTAATLVIHNRRVQQATAIMAGVSVSPSPMLLTWAAIVAFDATVVSDATSGNATDITSSAGAAAAALLVTDAHISNAIAANFNVWLSPS